MNEDGVIVCEEHKPERGPYQWWVALEFDHPCKCDHCDKQAAFYVLEKK